MKALQQVAQAPHYQLQRYSKFDRAFFATERPSALHKATQKVDSRSNVVEKAMKAALQNVGTDSTHHEERGTFPKV